MSMADCLDLFRQCVQVAFVESVNQGLLMRKILLHRTDRDASALGHSGSGQPLWPVNQQKLNGRLENRIQGYCRAGLNGPFAGVQGQGCR